LGAPSATSKTFSASQLFPELKPYKGKVTQAWSKRFGRYLDTVKITDRRKVFHSYRHGVKSILRDAGVPGKVQDAMLGHAAGYTAGDANAGDGYGLGYGLEQLRKAVEAIQYPGVTLPPKGTPPNAVPAPLKARRMARPDPASRSPRRSPPRSRPI